MKPREDELDTLREELHRLERRVVALEHGGVPEPDRAALTEGIAPGEEREFAIPGAVPVVGRAVLGLAGAFLFRALAEAGILPGLAVVAIAVAYAAAWLVFSVRTRANDAFAGTAYGITGALILAPLLWEATVRFNVLRPAATAGILTAFVVLSSALAWSRDPGVVTSLTTLATVVTAAALMLRTGDLVPFAGALLAIACIVEGAACRDHATSMRIPAAVAADFALWALLYLMTRPGGVPSGYQPVSVATALGLCAGLFAIYAGSVAWRAVALGRIVSVFEIVQAGVATALAGAGALQVTHGAAAPAVGALFALGCASCYFTAFLAFGTAAGRNFHAFAGWGAALGLAASFLILPAPMLTVLWSAAAVVATLSGVRIHGTVYLVAAGLISGLPAAFLNAFASAAPEPPGGALWTIAISSACCYAACLYAGSGRIQAKASVVAALVTAVSAGALLMQLIVPLAGGGPSPSLLATARTLVTCSLALALGFAGRRTDHRELVWLSYAALTLGTVKLLLEDFRQSSPAALAVSLLCYGAVLVLTPKTFRADRKETNT